MTSTKTSNVGERSGAGGAAAPLHPKLAGDIYIGRQAVLDRRREVWAYELLYRTGYDTEARVTDGHHATSQVIVNAFVDIGLERVVGKHPMLIQFPRETLLSFNSMLLPKDRVLIELSATADYDIQLLATIKYLAAQGYKLVIASFRNNKPELQPLLEIAYAVKVDVGQLQPDALKEVATELRRYRVKRIASKVENKTQYDMCHALGFDYFQGFFLQHPQVVSGRRLPADQQRMFQLLSELNKEDPNLPTIERIIGNDATLSYRLLRCLNSASFSLPAPVQTVRHALVMLGMRNLAKWVSLLAISATKDQPAELVRIALVRAQMCHNLAQHAGRPAPQAMFTIGLLSVLDALLGRSMADILKDLPLTNEAQEALLNRGGFAGSLLACAEAYERGEWNRATLPNLGTTQISTSYLDALEWADASADNLSVGSKS